MSTDTNNPHVLVYLILHIKDYQYPSVCYNGIVVPETTPTDTIYDYYAHYFDKSFGAIAANGKKWGRMPPRPRNRYDDNGNAIGHINW